jgi:hypothetical protein
MKVTTIGLDLAKTVLRAPAILAATGRTRPFRGCDPGVQPERNPMMMKTSMLAPIST